MHGEPYRRVWILKDREAVKKARFFEVGIGTSFSNADELSVVGILERVEPPLLNVLERLFDVIRVDLRLFLGNRMENTPLEHIHQMSDDASGLLDGEFKRLAG